MIIGDGCNKPLSERSLSRKLHGPGRQIWSLIMVIVLCNDAEIEVPDGEVCQICGCELEEFDEVTGTGIFGYYHWICVSHADA